MGCGAVQDREGGCEDGVRRDGADAEQDSGMRCCAARVVWRPGQGRWPRVRGAAPVRGGSCMGRVAVWVVTAL